MLGWIAALMVALALATPAHAWNRCGAFDASSAGTAADKSLSSQASRWCHDTSSTVDSAYPLRIESNHFSVELDPNMAAGDSGASGCTVTIYRCRSGSATSADLTSCTEICPDSDFDGTPNCGTTLDGVTVGRRGIDWATAPWLLVDVTANASSHNCRTQVTGY